MKRDWHRPVKSLKRAKKGKCPICNKSVKNLEAHKNLKHLNYSA